VKIGSVALVDALGWKGIWRRFSVSELAQKLDALEKGAKIQVPRTRAKLKDEVTSALHPSGIELDVEVSFLSDTIAIGASFDVPEASEDVRESEHCAYARAVVVDLVAELIRHAATDHPPLIYRGAIASGRLHMQRTMLIGEAVDRAAELMNMPDDSFIWCDPACLSYLDTGGLLEYCVPLRDGRRVRAMVVNPFGACSGETSIAQVLEGFGTILRDDKGNLDVIIKRNNTDELLRCGWRARRESLGILECGGALAPDEA